MKLKKFREVFSHELGKLYSQGESETILNYILIDALGLSKLAIISQPQLELNDEQAQKVLSLLNDLKKGIPIQHLLGEVVGGMAVGVEQLRGAAIAAGGAAYTQVDAPRRQGVEHSKLLSHFERRIVRQHDARRAQTNAGGASGNRCHQDLGCRAHNAGMAVVFADPKTVIAPGLAALGKF